MDIKSTFIRGKMNKSVDERLVPPGEYVNAVNVRLGSTEISEIGAVENSKGNTSLTPGLAAGRIIISQSAVCLGSYADSTNNTIYWFVHDNNFNFIGNIADIVYSFNTETNIVKEHLTALGTPTQPTKLNFNPKFLITGISKIEDLLFFTDNFNPPRFINVKKNYDQVFVEEDISVVVKPPGYALNQLSAPNINLFNSSLTEENYIVDKFLSFAYRYKYEDNQYSAVSLFSETAFEPKDFELDYSTRENLGMENNFNAITIQVSTGEKRVVGFDILFKASNSNVIFVIEKIDKLANGIDDNTIYSYPLTSQKIYSTLGSDELLRQYDNVPLIAKSQIIQGNRLMYGNYEDGRDIKLDSGEPINIQYTPTVISNEVSTTNVQVPVQETVSNLFSWTINPFNGGTNFVATASGMTFTFLDQDGNLAFPGVVPANTVFDLSIAFRGLTSTQLDPSSPTFPTDFPQGYIPFAGATITIPVQWITSVEYGSVQAMLQGDDFQEAIGTNATIQTIPNAENGSTLTDRFNSLIKNAAPSTALGFSDDFNLVRSSVNDPLNNQAFPVTVNSNGFTIHTTGVGFLIASNTSSTVVFSYFATVASASSLSFGSATNARSLHSNRDYDIGLVYMDSFGRATSALTSPNSSIHIPASQSDTQNIIQVQINNPPPPWAAKYKYVIKPNAGNYNIIYTTRYYKDRQKPDIVWFKLEGEQKNLVTDGTKLILKADNTGPLNILAVETVLEVRAWAAGELGPSSATGSLEGLYMSIQSNFVDVSSIENDAQGNSPQPSSFMYAARAAESDVEECDTQTIGRTVQFPVINIDGGLTSTWENYTIPAGSVIRINMSIKRRARTSGVQTCDWAWNARYVSPANYNSFKDWFEGEQIYNLIGGTKNIGLIKPTGNWASTPLSFGQTIVDNAPYFGCNTYTIGFQEVVSLGSGKFWLYLSHGVPRQGPGYKKSPVRASVRVRVQRSNDLIAFETIASEADPNLYFDASEFYDIGNDLNNNLSHKGNVQDQQLNTQVPAINNLSFFNCYTFGNGIESIKILDLATEVSVNLGERTTAVSNENIKRAHRFASITYSGVYSGINNLNNLNEFNLGLVNYQDYENSFGSIMKLHARETDVLVLQEDKISYVLTSKNLISDSTGGGAITSVPQVLGTQIARIEEFGISSNPESFAVYGKDMFFSDVKRNAIIKLSGGSIKSDTLEIISESGMRSFFRDSFIDNTNTQKLGGYDPYMGEYVFSNSSNLLPEKEDLIPCGTELRKENNDQTLTFSYQLDTVVSSVDIDVTIDNNSSDITLTAEWNGTTVIDATTDPNSVNIVSTPLNPFQFDKTLPYPLIVKVTITANTTSSYSLTVNCPTKKFSYLTRIVLSTNIDTGKTLHAGYQFRDTNTSPPFGSPVDNQAITLTPASTYGGATWIESQYGVQSLGSIPYNGTLSVTTIDQLYGDTYEFNDVENRVYVIEDQALFPVYTLQAWENAGGAEILSSLTFPPPVPLTITNPGGGTSYRASTSTGLINYNENINLLVVIDLRDHTFAQVFYGAIGFPLNCSYYDAIPMFTFEANSDPVTDQFTACNLDLNNLPPGQIKKDYGHRGVNSGSPRLGDPCRLTPSSGVRMLPGWYKISSGNRVIQIGSGTQRGIVINKINC